ncbi:prolyl hydroxylase family protein [Alteriqipengyuania lutimaris]|uniref:prolyl hydroxylase family protein n=1 Tax=Alteriqipengyuania lutimaris TaxID=1538146 RepID=UPI0015F1B579|nr:2OG-Fe(II) oxygenase [Alteriqipengyuania lutimaris]MBB3033458.1 prolyl 4-hydroxylase [Alteriqipengyuania lutimaris]
MAEDVRHLTDSEQLDRAVTALRSQLAEGNGEAAFILAYWRVEGISIRRDLDEATALFRRAVELGYEAARGPLAAMLAHGYGQSRRDWQGALQQLASYREPTATRHARLIDAMQLDPEGNPGRSFSPEILCRDPLVLVFREFLTRRECKSLVELASPALRRSQVVHPQTGQLVDDPIRNSSSAAFTLTEETPFLHAINRRIAAASRSRPEQGEPTQVLSYEAGQEYKLHHDALPGEQNQRIQTFLIYLNEDYEGGEIHFPTPNLRFRGNTGDALCFSNVSANMQPARNAAHAGLPVVAGRKIILSKWIRRSPLDLTGPAGLPY